MLFRSVWGGLDEGVWRQRGCCGEEGGGGCRVQGEGGGCWLCGVKRLDGAYAVEVFGTAGDVSNLVEGTDLVGSAAEAAVEIDALGVALGTSIVLPFYEREVI